MTTFSNVFIWRGGVRHWAAFDEPRHIVRPASARFIGPAPDRARPLRLVDEDAWSGLTLLRTAHALRSAGWEVAELAANTCVALDMAATGAPFRALDPLPPERPLIAVCGLPGSGKSAVAWTLAASLNLRYHKWARFVTARCNPGRYGEQAAALEQHDPLVFARAALPALLDEPLPIVLDGVKSLDALVFLARAARRPLIPLWIEVDESVRRMTIAARGDADDGFDAPRRELFEARFRELRAACIPVRMDGQDHSLALSALAAHGLRLPLPVPNALMDKRAAIDIPRYNAHKPGRGALPQFPEWLVFHTSYSARYGLSGQTAFLVNLVASAFRIIDDIIDEHPVRALRRPDGSAVPMTAVWRVCGPWQAVYYAAAMLAHAVRIAPDPDACRAMIDRVHAATVIELDAEQAGRPMSEDEYRRSLDKEVAFREWIAGLAGADPDALRRDAIRAQIKNDRLSAGLEAARLPDSRATEKETP